MADYAGNDHPFKCRCDVCAEAKRTYNRAKYAADPGRKRAVNNKYLNSTKGKETNRKTRVLRAAKQAEEFGEFGPSQMEHGRKRYWKGCRCLTCKAGNAAYADSINKRNPEAKRRRNRNWLSRNKDLRNSRRRSENASRNLAAGATVRKRYKILGVQIELLPETPVQSKELVYALVDPIDLKVRYVGVSSTGLGRPKWHFTPGALQANENKRKCDWIRRLKVKGLSPAIRVLEYFSTREDARSAEPYWIQWMRDQGEHLYNITAGNDLQIRTSEETKEKMRQKMKGRVITWGDKISVAKNGQGAKLPPVFEHEGTSQPLKTWVEYFNTVKYGTAYLRIRQGWPWLEAVTTPARCKKDADVVTSVGARR